MAAAEAVEMILAHKVAIRVELDKISEEDEMKTLTTLYSNCHSTASLWEETTETALRPTPRGPMYLT